MSSFQLSLSSFSLISKSRYSKSRLHSVMSFIGSPFKVILFPILFFIFFIFNPNTNPGLSKASLSFWIISAATEGSAPETSIFFLNNFGFILFKYLCAFLMSSIKFFQFDLFPLFVPPDTAASIFHFSIFFINSFETISLVL